MDHEYIIRHENDILILKMRKKLLLKQVAEIEREILIIRQYNRQIKGRE